MFQLTFYKKFVAAGALFIFALIAALLLDNFWWMILPFFWLLAPLAFDALVHKTSSLFYLLLFFLPLSTEFNFTPSLGLDLPDELLLISLTAIVFLLIIYKPSVFPLPVLKHPLFFILMLHIFWIFISCLVSTSPLLSLKFLAAKIWYVVPFVLIPLMLNPGIKQFKTIAYLLLLPMLFVVLQSLARHAIHNFSFEGVKETLSPFFRNHVTYSAMLVCLIPVLAAARKNLNQQKKFLGNICLFIAFAGVVFAYSRGAWLALLVGLIAAFIFHYRLLKPVLLVLISVLVIAGIWLGSNKNYLRFAHDYNTTIFHQNIGEHLQASVKLKDVSNAERFYRWVAATNMIAEKPITGFGPNTFYPTYKSYTEKPFKTWVSDNPEHSTVHNYFLLIFIEQGLPGLLLFSFLLIGMLFNCQRLYHSFKTFFYKKTALVIGVVLTMIAFLLCSSDLLETDKIGSLFWLSLGLIFVLQTKLEQEKSLLNYTEHSG